MRSQSRACDNSLSFDSGAIRRELYMPERGAAAHRLGHIDQEKYRLAARKCGSGVVEDWRRYEAERSQDIFVRLQHPDALERLVLEVPDPQRVVKPALAMQAYREPTASLVVQLSKRQLTSMRMTSLHGLGPYRSTWPLT
jgi:hypothetical protein